MTAGTVRPWAPRPNRKDRLAVALVAEGLGGGGSAPWRHDLVELSRRLRRALDRLGPVHQELGRYLAARVDLLPAAACLELAGSPAGPIVTEVALSPEAVVARLEAELEEPVGKLFLELDPEPLAAGAFRQRYRARTLAGEEVEVVLARPEALPEAESRELEPLGRVLDLAGLPARELLVDFERLAVAKVDLETEAELLAETRADGETFAALVVPHVDRALSRRRVLVHEAVPGRRPGDLAAFSAAERPDRVRRLALVWLHQALFGRAFPLAPAGAGTRILPDGRVAFVSGPFRTLPSACRESLWRYLEAGVVEDPTAACDRLLPELVREAHGATEGELLLRLRQVVAFRDGGLGDGADPLADHVFTTLEVARELGYRARRPAADFLRGLAPLAILGMAVAPDTEPVRRAIEELRLQRTAADLRGVLDPTAWKELPAPYATLLMELPRKLDSALDLLSRGEAKVRLELVGTPRRRISRGGLALALGAVAGALTLAAPRLAELLPADGGGGGTAGTVALALLAGVLVASLAWRR